MSAFSRHAGKLPWITRRGGVATSAAAEPQLRRDESETR